MANKQLGFAALSGIEKKSRQVFVAYPYRIYPKADYRKVYNEVGKALSVSFVFADEKITDLHILEKIKLYIKESAFSICDITGWNPNVTLELGLAMGMGERAYIAFDPSKTDVQEVPADLRGIDRLQYSSYSELNEKLLSLISQELPVSVRHEAEDQLEKLRKDLLTALADAPDGLRVTDIASLLGISIDLAKLVVRPLFGDKLQTTGATRGTRYVLTAKSRRTQRHNK